MKVKVGSTYICDGPDRSSGKWMGPLNSLARDVQEETQAEPLIRATDRFLANRSNLLNSIELSVVKHHSTIADAWASVLTLGSLSGTITFEYASTSKTMTGIARLISVRNRGLAVYATYRLLGGTIT